MARGGINKAVVQKARQALLSRGINPSIDAVRVELGNTGSKSTISRYLKELDGVERPISELRDRIGNALTASVESLLDQVMEEGNKALALAQAQFDERVQALEERNQSLENELTTLRRQFEALQSALEAQTAELKVSDSSLREELGRNARLAQTCAELERRIEERDEQIQSLEDKHVHARSALEHYRDAIKEQREQDQRRHDGQLQSAQGELRQVRETLAVKQDELTRLNRDNERLIGEARQQTKAWHKQSDEMQSLTAQIQALTLSEAKASAIIDHHEGQVQELREEVKHLNIAAALAAGRETDLNKQAADLQAQLAIAMHDAGEKMIAASACETAFPTQDNLTPKAATTKRREKKS